MVLSSCTRKHAALHLVFNSLRARHRRSGAGRRGAFLGTATESTVLSSSPVVTEREAFEGDEPPTRTPGLTPASAFSVSTSS
jgi:hypothetical protein